MLEVKPEFQELFARYSPVKIAQYQQFRKASPQVFDAFVTLAKQYRDAGRTKCSAALIGNVIRWHTAIGEIKGDYRISNNWLPFMARELIVQDSSFTNFFTLRDN